jgi:hypothetical protein
MPYYIYMEECLPDVVQTSTPPLNEGDILHHANDSLNHLSQYLQSRNQQLLQVIW